MISAGTIQFLKECADLGDDITVEINPLGGLHLIAVNNCSYVRISLRPEALAALLRFVSKKQKLGRL